MATTTSTTTSTTKKAPKATKAERRLQQLLLRCYNLIDWSVIDEVALEEAVLEATGRRGVRRHARREGVLRDLHEGAQAPWWQSRWGVTGAAATTAAIRVEIGRNDMERAAASGLSAGAAFARAMRNDINRTLYADGQGGVRVLDNNGHWFDVEGEDQR